MNVIEKKCNIYEIATHIDNASIFLPAKTPVKMAETVINVFKIAL